MSSSDSIAASDASSGMQMLLHLSCNTTYFYFHKHHLAPRDWPKVSGGRSKTCKRGGKEEWLTNSTGRIVEVFDKVVPDLTHEVREAPKRVWLGINFEGIEYIVAMHLNVFRSLMTINNQAINPVINHKLC